MAFVRFIPFGGTPSTSGGLLTLHSDPASVSTPGSGFITPLKTYVLLGGTLANDGDFLEIHSWGRRIGGSFIRVATINWGGTQLVGVSGVLSAGTFYYDFKLTIVRKGATSQETVSFGVPSTGQPVLRFLQSKDLTNDVTIEAMGQSFIANGVWNDGFTVKMGSA